MGLRSYTRWWGYRDELDGFEIQEITKLPLILLTFIKFRHIKQW